MECRDKGEINKRKVRIKIEKVEESRSLVESVGELKVGKEDIKDKEESVEKRR